MAQNIQEFKLLMKAYLKDEAALIDLGGWDKAREHAINTFSKDNPKIIKGDIDGADSYEYSLPSNWVSDFSWISSIEYPADKQDPEYLDEDQYIVYDNATTKKIRFIEITPQTGKTIRVEHSVKWLIDKDTCNIPTQDFAPVACLATAYCLRMLADHFGQTTEPSISADVIDYARKSIEFIELADSMENIYRRHLGMPPLGSKEAAEKPSSPASSHTKDLDIMYNWGGDMLTHPKSQR